MTDLLKRCVITTTNHSRIENIFLYNADNLVIEEIYTDHVIEIINRCIIKKGNY